MSKKADRFVDERVINLINTYISDLDKSETAVSRHNPFEALKNKIDTTITPDGCTLDDLYKFIDNYLEYSVRTGHRQFFNQLWSGYTLPGLLGDLFTSLTNTSMYTFEVSPVATILELALIEKMGKYIGYSDPEGQFGTGGSNGNLLAMLIARNRELPDSKKKGVRNGQNLIAFVSDQAHYSFEKAANMIGIGTDQVQKVLSDEEGRMKPEELERMIIQAKEEGKAPFFVAATAGTTVRGAFDPCEQIGLIAHNYNTWFHIDGSLGGSVLLSPTHRHLLEGSDISDSFVWNAHKMMGLPLICSAFLVKEKGNLLKTFSTSGTDYIFHENELGAYDLGPKSPQCGRKVDVLKLWLSWKYYGDQGYADRIDRFFELSTYAEEKVKAHPALELMSERTSVNICFRYNTSKIEDLNLFNLNLREKLAREGKSLVNYANIGADVTIRLVILNHEVDRSDIDLFFENLIQTAESLL
ncbi:pyridoxal phosphate-dependent decarboxylase family protein [Acidobacteriota bacterium]